jgi:hypothetical protein
MASYSFRADLRRLAKIDSLSFTVVGRKKKSSDWSRALGNGNKHIIAWHHLPQFVPMERIVSNLAASRFSQCPERHPTHPSCLSKTLTEYFL